MDRCCFEVKFVYQILIGQIGVFPFVLVGK
jgi:hypothetical protein